MIVYNLHQDVLSFSYFVDTFGMICNFPSEKNNPNNNLKYFCLCAQKVLFIPIFCLQMSYLAQNYNPSLIYLSMVTIGKLLVFTVIHVFVLYVCIYLDLCRVNE